MADYKAWLSDLTNWLKDVKDHEVKDTVTRFVESEQALKDLGQERVRVIQKLLTARYRTCPRKRITL